MTAAVAALRRLLADIRAARDYKTGDPPSVPLWGLSSDELDYLERLALDGLAGEAKECACYWCRLHRRHPTEPTEEGGARAGERCPTCINSILHADGSAVSEHPNHSPTEPTEEGQP